MTDLEVRRQSMVSALTGLARRLKRVPTLPEFASAWASRTVKNWQATAMIASWWGNHSGKRRYTKATHALYRAAGLRLRRPGRPRAT